MRTIRNFTLRLGEIVIPVGLCATATDDDDRLFRTLHTACKTPIRLATVCPNHEPVQLLEPEETVKAWEVAPGQFLELAPDEVATLMPADSSTIELNGFVRQDELDPLLVRKRYHLQPGKTGVGKRAYLALAHAMHEHDVAAVARFNAWNSEQLAQITARPGGILELATLRQLDELVQTDAIGEQLADIELADVEAELMHELVQRYTRRLLPDDLASVERPRLMALLEAKLAGQPIVEPEADPAPEGKAPTVDLETALRRSLRAAPRKRHKRTPVRSTA